MSIILMFRFETEQQIIAAHTQNSEKEIWFLGTLKMITHMVTLPEKNRYLLLVYAVILQSWVNFYDYAA